MIKTFATAAVVAATFATGASAAVLNGTFSIDIYQRLDATTAEASATLANLAAADTVLLDTITFTGDLDFGTFDGTDSTTIGDWLATSVGGIVDGLDAMVANTQLSMPSIGSGTATATFFDITGFFNSAFDSIIRHDDGIRVFDDGTQIASRSAPTVAVNTAVNGFDGGDWRLLYVATNGDPSVLRVTGDDLPTTATVPLPAGMPLLLAGLGGLAFMRRRAKS